MEIRSCCRILAVVLCNLAAVIAAHAQVLNNSFEDPAITGSYATGSGSNWTATGTAYIFANRGGYGTTSYGTQYADLYPSTTDAQSVGSLTLGSTYTLSLVAANVDGGSSQQLTLTISGGATASANFPIPMRTMTGNNPLAFVNYSINFTPTSNTPVTITLMNSGSSSSGVAVDNVQLGFAAAPEPSTWAMLGLGAVGAVALNLRRRVRAD